MGAECCNKDCLKPSVVSYGVVAWLSSGAALGVGIWMLVEKSTYNSLLDSLFYPATIYILIAAGTFGFIFAVFGCAGAMTDSRCMLALFWITSFVAFAALGSTGFLALYYHDNVLRKDINIRQAINESETNKDLMTVIDKLQTEFRCCGERGASDWHKLPDSCCPEEPTGTCDFARAHGKGCEGSLETWVRENVFRAGWIALGLSLVQVSS
ncbi:CD151 antigen-like isoform X1 [Branchiostoma floridae]|uniref:Tetraspanin n=1 Tax=Branchiostoma floridae TaxID=7739 RepID=A0A9J7NBG5_BRAFL|nr:CD151 antigen-like isoform X1 [Branchiostoma floridae]